jgi:transcriptional regulator with XRE-family HTH domain
MEKKRGLKMGSELRAIMEKEGISAYRISKETGIGQSYISKILHDKAIPNCVTLKRILDVLGYEIHFVKAKKRSKEK